MFSNVIKKIISRGNALSTESAIKAGYCEWNRPSIT